MLEVGDFTPVIGILGPRQVGKTTLAKIFLKELEKETIYLDLERPSDFQKLAEPELFLRTNQDKCVVIDEVQLMPQLFPLIRALVDEHRIPLRFVLLGSASPDIIRDSSESLAGRISYIQLHPFSRFEIPETPIQKHHFLGGFPLSILAKSEKQSLRWLDDFINTYITRDLPILGMPANPVMTRRLWEMLAWQNGSLLNASSLGKSLGITNHTVNTYMDFLEGAFMIHRIKPFYVNMKKRIVKTPKIYISDTGILHRLLGLESFDSLFGSPMLGGSWEAFVINQIMAEKPKNIDLFFYRTHAGTEVDIVLTKAQQPVASLEVKFTSTPVVTKGFWNGIADLGTKHNFIITPVDDEYPAKANITVIGLDRFLKRLGVEIL